MKESNILNPFKNFKSDIPASIVVFLVAMPLCLGIALASGAPLFAGIISGVVGGIVVGSLSGSSIGVSGPAAGLAVIVLNAITDLGSYEVFLVSVIIAGIIQLIMGIAKAGIIAHFFPSSVIHGMLAGIGIIIFLKQLPHAFGYDLVPEGNQAFIQSDGYNTLDELIHMFSFISPGVVIVSLVSLFILIIWGTKLFKKMALTKIFPGPLVAVAVGIILNIIFKSIPNLAISTDHLVSVPVPESTADFFSNFKTPDFANGLSNPKVYITAIIIAVVASLETLLSLEASDKLDTLKRISPANQELRAQGIGNMLAGFIGGIPVTQVIVRSSANQQSGAKTKASAVIHGVLLLLSVIVIPFVLNMIPLGVLAAILLLIGFKLSSPKLFKKMYKDGLDQFLPFMVTVLGIVFTDLLKGIALGMVIAVFIILRNNYRIPFKLLKDNLEGKDNLKLILSEDVSFLNKASILKLLNQIPNNTSITIDATEAKYIHFDVIEIIEDFKVNAELRSIRVKIINLYKDKVESPIQHFTVKTNKK